MKSIDIVFRGANGLRESIWVKSIRIKGASGSSLVSHGTLIYKISSDDYTVNFPTVYDIAHKIQLHTLIGNLANELYSGTFVLLVANGITTVPINKPLTNQWSYLDVNRIDNLSLIGNFDPKLVSYEVEYAN